jgi:hypothetical protein
MKTGRSAGNTEPPLILVEGPTWGDAEFYGQWLLKAAKANKLLQQAKSQDSSFCAAIDTIEIIRYLEFGIMGTVFVSMLVDKDFETFVLDRRSEDLVEFVLMVEMGFFKLTGDRYKMTLPRKLDVDRVKHAHLKLAATEDEDWVHPERLVVDMPHSKAKKYQSLLLEMNQGQRLADRRALLFLD